jgi:gas vesicle protein
MSDRDEFGAFLVGFVVGGLTGAVVALLFAPQSGEETRTYIRDRSVELRDRASHEAEAAWRRAEAAAEEARVRAEELAHQARVRSEEITLKAREQGERFVSSAREQGEKIVETARKVTRRKGEEESAAPSEG